MDNLGSEVGQKMRSAVKAKLLELGTGGSAGYIDDELPDYVMIMVANKRSKQQMIADLNLFLGSQTDLFVTWLHEVLQKLQEVTLPAVALQKKRKTNQKEEATLSKKDKKDKKKDKKTQKKPSEQESTEITSITDVFAGELLEKAKKSFEVDANAVHKDKKQEKDTIPAGHKDETDDFNIPTISEMSSTQQQQQQRVVTSETREKDLAELADIQKKIFAAKKQLKILDDVDESEDEDFLNIKEDGEEFEESSDMAREKKKQSKAKSPIVFDRNQEEEEEQETSSPIPPPPVTVNEIRVVASSVDSCPLPIEKLTSSSGGNSLSSRMPTDYSHHHHQNKREAERSQEHTVKDGYVRKKSIHERLGHVARDYKNDHSHQHRRAEKELYVPAFRRREMEKEKRSNGEIDTRSSRKRSSSTDKRDKRDRDTSSERPLPQQRIGSRVVVAPPKPDLIDEDVDNQRPDRPVNSVIKIKPRPSISPSKQACKNLLLRAVAEAQRSTILVKPKKDISVRKSSSSGVVVGGISSSSTKRNTKFFTKSYRDRISRDALIRRTAKNFVIEVKADADREHENEDEEMEQDEDEEYVPEHISDRGESDLELIYIPQTINFASHEDEDISHETNDDNTNQSKTQFVVTLNDKSSSNYKPKSKSSSRLNGAEQQSSRTEVQHKSSRSEIIDIRSRLTLKKEQARSNERESNSSPSCSTPPRPSSSMSSSKKSELIKIYKRPKEVKKIVIKNDSEDDDFHSPKKESPNKQAATQHIVKEEKLVTSTDDQKPNDTEEDEGSMTPPLPVRKIEEKIPENNTPTKRKRQLIKFDLVNKQLRVEEPVVPAKRRSKSGDRENELHNVVETNADDGHKISIRNLESRKYDNLPSSLNSVPIDSSLVIKSKPKERCKYFPTCTKDTCEFYHPAAPCKSFPNCKFAEKCAYVHPKCKFDLTCTKVGCNFQHTTSMSGQLSAPPLSSHVVPVQNYKSISSTSTVATSMCKFYPNCSKPACPFFHPKMCKFGRHCINKMECNFYHHDSASSKFKWVASVV